MPPLQARPAKDVGAAPHASLAASAVKTVAGAQGLPQSDFFNVRLHPDAAEVTAPLQAKAVTRGQDIYFHPGQYQPGTPQGQALIAHELAHTLQTRQAGGSGSGRAPFVSQPGDAFEENADALARGETAHALAAPAGAALRSPFDSETPAERTRRQTLLQSISNATNTLIRLLQTSGLMNFETATTRNGVDGVVYIPLGANSPFASYADRNAQIRRIIGNLQAMGTQYRTTPVPGSFTPPTPTPSTGGYMSSVPYPPGGKMSGVNFQSSNAAWADLQAAYERNLLSQGLNTGQSPYDRDWFYLDPTATVAPGAARGVQQLRAGTQTGIYVVVPDIENEPLRYWRLTGSSPTPRGSTTVELWVDQLGYYYMYRGQRISVPNPHTQ
ncbi:MAG TPA: DUF4157 domain-containing protein [Opitutaceae bacterium]|nr:DUF4157 domain-containing protein [Opitutaceae bacterium]